MPGPDVPAPHRDRTRLVGVALVVLLLVGVGGTVAALTVGPLRPGGGHDAPRYVDETASSGLAQTYGGDDTYDTGGGVAVLDCDGDGRPDIYLPGGADPAMLYRNESPTGAALRFTRVASATTDLTAATGAYPIDIDSDGIADLVVLRNGGSELLRGIGDCRFEPANDTWGVAPTPGNTQAFSATWEGAATLPTLAFGQYVKPLPDGAWECPDNEVIRPAASGTGYASPTPLSPGFCPLSMLFSDWDGSGRRDLRVSNDRHYYGELGGGSEQLWRFEPGVAPRAYTAADGWVPLRLWGMGIASYDLTGDGYPEVYLTSQGANTLQTLVAGPSTPAYHGMARDYGIEATRPVAGGDPLPSTAWHPEFEDVNNDGFMDLLVTKGNVDEVPDFAQKDPNNLFLGQPGGMYTEGSEAAGIVTFDRGRGAALADFNSDGLLDLVVANVGTPVRLWRNVGRGSADAPAAMGGWLGVRLHEPGTNRDAIGAVVETRIGDQTARRELVVGGGHAGGQLGWTHVGLGDAASADVRVTWPDGEAGPWMTVAANQFVDIHRDEPGAAPWTPPAP